MTQPCRLCLKLKATQCQPYPRLKLILTSCVISQNWIAEQISKGGPNPLILRNLSQVFSFLPPMKAGVPVQKRSEIQPVCTHRLTKRGERPLRAGPGPCTVCVFMCITYMQTYMCVFTGNLHIYVRREDEGWLFWASMPDLSNTSNIIDLWQPPCSLQNRNLLNNP